MTCRFETCVNDALPNQSRCEAHLLRWVPGKPVEREPALPEWRKRSLAKDMSGWDRAA